MGLIAFTLETLGPDFLQGIYTPTSIFENLAPSSQIKPLLFVLMSQARQHLLAWGWEGKSNPHNSNSYQGMRLCHRIKYGLQSAKAVLEVRGCRGPGCLRSQSEHSTGCAAGDVPGTRFAGRRSSSCPRAVLSAQPRSGHLPERRPPLPALKSVFPLNLFMEDPQKIKTKGLLQ